MSFKPLLPALLCAALAAGCAATGGNAGPQGEAPELAGKSFMWTGGVSEDCELPPTIAFSAEGRISGLAGCNRLLGQYKQDGTSLDLGEVATTMKLCAPSFMKVEDEFLGFLRQVRYATQASDGIDLWDADGKKIVTLVPERAGKCD